MTGTAARRLAPCCLLALAGAVAPLASAAAAPEGPALDVVIAIDTTGSMTPSIEQAKRDARQVVIDTQAAIPGSRFAVVQFRDSTDAVEYQLIQPMTAEPDQIVAALTPLYADGGDDSPEAYNLVFTRVASDPEIGFRPEARRLLVVIGDAEPHGAGKAGLAGCSDTSPDPHGLAAPAALEGLRNARISLSMILQSASASTALECYRSLAAGAFGQGSARASGPPAGEIGPGPRPLDGSTVATTRGGAKAVAGPPLAEALSGAIRSAFPRAVLLTPRAGRAGWRVVVTNPTGEAARVAEVRVILPAGARYVPGSARGLTRTEPILRGRLLLWRLPRTALPAGKAPALRFSLRGPAAGATATARVVLADGSKYLTPR
jgi:VWA domain-containing protein